MKTSPKTPGQLFLEALEQLGISKSEAGRRIGVQYYRVYRWGKDKEFTPQNQERAARGLGLPGDAFSKPSEAERRELERQRVWNLFLSRRVAQECPPEVIRVLESLQFRDEKPRPTLAIYETIAAYMLGLIDEHQVSEVADYNERLAEENDAHKPTKPR